MIELFTDELSLVLDPAHGAEVLELNDRRWGRQLLGRPPFEPLPPRGGDLDEEAWTKRYRGGWQLAAPNAGNACLVGTEHHGFHGQASVDPWEVLDVTPVRAVFRWSGHGLELTRQIAVAGATVSARLEWTAARVPAPLIAVEHICFGRALLDPALSVTIDASAHELSEREESPISGRPTRWPSIRLLNGGVARTETFAFDQPQGRYVALTDFGQPRAELRNTRSGYGVVLTWDGNQLPYAWLWQEVRASGGLWNHQAELLALEPASVPHGLGLEEAIARGQARWARAEYRHGYWVSMTLLRP